MRTLDILLVDDNSDDALLAAEAFRDIKVPHTLHFARDGVEAMDFLHRTGTFAGVPRPDLVLLDLNMPRRDGREALAEIKADPVLKRIPVIVLTTSAAESDVERCYELGANCFLTKPVDYGEFVAVVRALDAFWFRAATLPAKR